MREKRDRLKIRNLEFSKQAGECYTPQQFVAESASCLLNEISNEQSWSSDYFNIF